jgi:hypothetical protein
VTYWAKNSPNRKRQTSPTTCDGRQAHQKLGPVISTPTWAEKPSPRSIIH